MSGSYCIVITGSKARNSQQTNRDYKTQNFFLKRQVKQWTPGGVPWWPSVRISGFHGLDLGSVPGQETEIPVRHVS